MENKIDTEILIMLMKQLAELKGDIGKEKKKLKGERERNEIREKEYEVKLNEKVKTLEKK